MNTSSENHTAIGHEALRAQYAADATHTDKPWLLWQFVNSAGNWADLDGPPTWFADIPFRRKPIRLGPLSRAEYLALRDPRSKSDSDGNIIVHYNIPGHVCPETGRLAMTVAAAHKREDSHDRQFWLYVRKDAASGLDPWRPIRKIDGSDANLLEIYAIEWVDGTTSQVLPHHVVYMQRTRAERAEAVTQSPTAADALRMTLAALAPVLYTIDLASENGMTVTLKGMPGITSPQAQAYALSLMAFPGRWRVTGIDCDRT